MPDQSDRSNESGEAGKDEEPKLRWYSLKGMQNVIANYISKRNLRWYQFTLRELMIFIAILAPLFAWIGYEIRVSIHQRNAIREIEETGARAAYSTGSGVGNAIGVFFTNAEVTENALVRLRDLPYLSFLEFTNTNLSDADLVHIRNLHDIHISFTGTQVTTEGIAELRAKLPDCDIEWDGD